ncbi:MAG: HDOD domain-containing protein [Candidatus Eisenbacteria bacterium]|nr:HDOD domain-containing protein [Candidatus Eisenbacteria bacterium]
MIPIQELLRDAARVEPLGASASRLAKLMRDPSADMEETLAAVRANAELPALLIRHAGTEPLGDSRAKPGAIRPVADLHEAVLILGGSRVLFLAILQKVSTLMLPALPVYGLREKDLLRHGLASALAVEQIERISSSALPAGTMSAALLHDIGKLPLDARAGTAHRELLGRTHAAHAAVPNHAEMVWDLSQAEAEVFGAGHALLGARIAERWGLGPETVSAIRFHHEPSSIPSAAIDAVRVANVAARTVGCGLGMEGLGFAADASACGRLGMTRHDFEHLCAQLHARLPRFLSALQPILGQPADGRSASQPGNREQASDESGRRNRFQGANR